VCKPVEQTRHISKTLPKTNTAEKKSNSNNYTKLAFLLFCRERDKVSLAAADGRERDKNKSLEEQLLMFLSGLMNFKLNCFTSTSCRVVEEKK